MVQWSAFGYDNLGSRVRYPLASFHYLKSPPSGQGLPKLLPYCPQTGLTMLYAAISLSSFSTYSSENVNFRGVTIEIFKKKSTPNNRQRQVHRCLHKSLLAPAVHGIEKKP